MIMDHREKLRELGQGVEAMQIPMHVAAAELVEVWPGQITVLGAEDMLRKWRTDGASPRERERNMPPEEEEL